MIAEYYMTLAAYVRRSTRASGVPVKVKGPVLQDVAARLRGVR